MKAKKLDRIFDDGSQKKNEEDILQHFDLLNVSRPNLKKERVNVDFPVWMIEDLDRAAVMMGVTRQAVIKIWLVERLKIESA